MKQTWSRPYLQITPAQVGSKSRPVHLEPAQRTGRKRLSCMHGLFTTSRKRPGYAAEEIHCARYLHSLQEKGVAVFCNRNHLTSGRGETWRKWSSLELQVEKAEKCPRRSSQGPSSKCWVSALLAFSRDGSMMHRAWPELLFAVIQVAERLAYRCPRMCLLCEHILSRPRCTWPCIP